MYDLINKKQEIKINEKHKVSIYHAMYDISPSQDNAKCVCNYPDDPDL